MHNLDGFRMAIVVNGNEQRIINGNVYIPFNTEYSVRIVNNNSVKGKIKLSVDGIAEDEYFIVDPNSTITISRFMCGNKNKGNSFLFVKQDDERVNNPSNNQNGIISVQCWKEFIQTTNSRMRFVKEYEWPDIQPWEPYTPYTPWKPWEPYKQNKNWDYIITWTNTVNNFNGPMLQNASCNYLTAAPETKFCSSNKSQQGATVGGNENNQQFYEAADFPTCTNVTNLSIKLMGKN